MTVRFEEAPKSSGSSWLKGCLIAVGVVFLLILLGLGLFFWYGYRQITKFVQNEPLPIATAPLPEPEFKTVQAQVQGAQKQFDAKQPLVLDLTVAQINGLIASDPHLAELKGKVQVVEIADGKITADASVPLAQAGHPGKFLNARLTVSLALTDGLPDLRLVSVTNQGKTPPDFIMNAFRQQNMLFTFAQNDPQAMMKLGQLQDRLKVLTAADGKLHLEAQ